MVVKKSWNLAILKGDGVGPEVIDAALPTLNVIKNHFNIKINIKYGDAGYYCIKKYNTNLPDKTIALLKDSDMVSKGPMTTPEVAVSPESAAVKIRKIFDLYANVRPAKSIRGIKSLKDNVDLIIVRENTEGMYSGKEFMVGNDTAISMRIITKKATERAAIFAFELARKRKKHLTYVHKQNILKIGDGLFNNTIMEVYKKYKNVKIDSAHIDAMAQWLIKQPEIYDVIFTENLFGDIISDESAMVVGGMGIAPAANIGYNYAMFEPVHGSAPKYTNKDIVNPIATIFSIKMMFEWMGYTNASKLIDDAVNTLIKDGTVLTYDLGGKAKCSEVGQKIAGIIEHNI